MNDLDLTFIGSGNAFAPAGLCWNGFLLNGTHLFETPPSTLMALNRLGIDANTIETIVLTHHHGDHFLGLPFLFLHWKYRCRTRPVRIIGPRGTRATALAIAETVFPGCTKTDLPIEWIEPAPGELIRSGGLELVASEVEHDPELSQCFGYGARIGGRRLGYTGDSRLCDAVRDLARSSEVLVSECASRADRVPMHMNLVDDMPILRQLMHADAHLLLTHIDADVDSGGLPNTRIAEDFATFKF